MSYRGTRSFHEDTFSGFLGDLGELFVEQENFDVYVCPQCGKIEFFVAGSLQKQPGSENLSLENLSLEIELSSPGTSTIPKLTDLLKLTQNATVLEDVYKSIGYPINSHDLKAGIVLCYPSEDVNNPHIVLINYWNHVVRLVSIFNHPDIFTLAELDHAYGFRELAGVIEGNEHWLFEENGVAFIAEGRNENEIMYMQFFAQKTTLAAYQELQGFSQETLICTSS
jgi:hypothetical protein